MIRGIVFPGKPLRRGSAAAGRVNKEKIKFKKIRAIVSNRHFRETDTSVKWHLGRSSNNLFL